MCDCSLPFGTTFNSMNNAIKTIVNENNSINLTAIKRFPTFQDIKDHLLSGYVILNYHWEDLSGEKGEHYVLLTESKDGKNLVINDDEDERLPINWHSDRKLKLYLKNYNFPAEDNFKDYEIVDREYPKAWFFK